MPPTSRIQADVLTEPALSPTRESILTVAGTALVADCAGALYWPEEGLLLVADLHLEKGSSFAARGVLLPPYDTAATLALLARTIARYAPRTVVALGDSFHDGAGPERIADSDRTALTALQRGRDWVWIAGNHDPEPVEGLGGICAATLALGPLVLRHRPDTDSDAKRARSVSAESERALDSLSGACPDRKTGSHFSGTCAEGEIAGHLHPVARVKGRGRVVSRRCFACDGARAVMPAFGTYAGGLNVRDRAFADVFEGLAFTAHLLGEGRLYAVAAKRCLGD